MLISVVIPVFNEEAALPRLLEVLIPVLESNGHDFEILFVDDGSRDGTSDLLAEMAFEESRIKVVQFSRNFGHQAAITAGLDIASGDAVVVMDADLQDPPHLLPDMISHFEQGFDVVSAQRISREGDGLFKRVTAAVFYRLMKTAVDERLTAEVGDFRLFSRAAVHAIRGFREQHRFLRGLIAWLGLKEAIIPFHRQARVAGVTKYPTWKMLKFAWTAISSFSALPLKLSLYAGLLLVCCGVIYGLPNWSSSKAIEQSFHIFVSVQLVLNGVLLISLGLLGDFVARIYEESKARPLFVVSKMINLGTPPRVTRGVWLRRANRALDQLNSVVTEAVLLRSLVRAAKEAERL